MKPNTLKISGINSFLEEQTIEFDKLIDKGLFGIFGATGSGKSTILDAITLALYGKVARETKSYINSDKDIRDGYIFFEFFSGHGSNRKRYIIERILRKTETGARTLKVKLEIYDLNDNTNPRIIEKVTSVEKELEQNIIKLNFDDFIRTVVLPQGKFSEFLTLTGGERNKMLERILGLEEYGENLKKKIQAKIAITKEKLDELRGESLGYVDVSVEKIKELEELKTEIEKKELVLKKDIEKLEKDYNKYTSVYELQEELKEYKDKNNELIKNSEQINNKENKLKKGKDAIHINPSVELLDLKEIELKENNELLNELQIELNELTASLKLVSDDYKKAYDVKERDYDNLIEKKTKLDHVITLEEDNIKEENSLKEEKTEYKNLKEKLVILENSLKTIEEEKEKIEVAINKCEELVKKKAISSKDKEVLINGREVEKKYIESIEQLKKLEEDILGHSKRIENGEKKIKELLKAEYILKTKLENQKEIYINLKEILYTKELFFRKKVKQVEEIRTNNLAYVLAQKLKEDSPCPVCGSLEHPDVVKNMDNTELEEKERLKDDLEKEIQDLKTDINLIELLFNTNKCDLNDLEYDLLEVDIDDYKETSENLKSKLEDINDNKIDLSTKNIKYSTAVEGIKEELKKAERERTELKEKSDKLEFEYINIKSRLNIENIEVEYKKLTDLEKEIELENKNIDDYRKKDKELLKSKENLLKEINEKKIKCSKLSTSIKNKEEVIKKNTLEITKVSGDDKPSNLKEKLEKSLKQIVKNEKDLREKLETLKDKNTKLIENKLNAEKSKQKLQNEIVAVTDKIDKLIKEYKFESIKSVRLSTLSKESLIELEESIEKYKNESKDVNSNIDRVEKILDGQSITRKELDEIEAQKSEKDDEQKELLEKKGSTVEKLKEMNNDIKRVKEIEKEMKKLEKRKDSLDEIDSITKAKRFVEFVSRSHLDYIAKEATEKLKKITRGKYGLILNKENTFEIRDNHNGGITRACNSLSGGETFLTSLALALALSTKIQLKGDTSMEFFFLDEGFGTLDVETLDTVMTAIENLHTDNLSVGIISHVEEIKNRVPIKLMVTAPIAGVSGSKVKIVKT